MLRGTLGATGVAGAALVGSGLLEPSYAGFPQIRSFLDKAHYQPGEAMTLKLNEDVRRPRKVRVTDSRGTAGRSRSRTTAGKSGRPRPGRPAAPGS